MTDQLDSSSLVATRRHFLRDCRLGLGGMALGSLLQQERVVGAGQQAGVVSGVAGPFHLPPRAKRVIFLFMAGGPSQLDLFDYKPKLQQFSGQAVPPSMLEGKRFSFLNREDTLLGTGRKFARYGQSGQEVSECLPHFARISDDVAIVKSMTTDVFNHGPAKFLTNTGYPRLGFPSMGAWISYGIGSESKNLPAFIVLQSGPRGPRGGSPLWGSGFLPGQHQGVAFRAEGDPITYLENPAGMSRTGQQNFVRAVADLNRTRFEVTGDPEIQTRIASYEMAFRMQQAAPEVMDLSGETAATLLHYGAERQKPSFARNCVLARRLVERGVRFVQLIHTDWDHHGGLATNLAESLDEICQQVDRPAAALVTDLKQRGLLDDTLVVWGGEFGRTPQGEIRERVGRDHHIDAYTMWLAGGGIKSGVTLGKTDELGFRSVEDQVHVHDLQATLLHLLGLDHLKLTHHFQGRDFRLTDVGGTVIEKLLA